ncbi:MAG: hypothetical protein WAV00_23865 [Nocardioides sp.]
MTEDTGQKLGIDWLKTIAGALAAVSAAVLLSTLGAAGTIIGAALGSVVATVGGALYSQGLARSHEHVARASQAARQKVWTARAEIRGANRGQGDGQAIDVDLTEAEERLDEAKDDLDAVAENLDELTWRERFAILPWKQISLAAAGVFVVAVLAITGFELVAGRTVSSITGGTNGGGGTTITHIGSHSHSSNQPSPTDQASPASPGTVGPLQQPTGSSAAVPSPKATTTAPTTPAPTGPTSAATTPTATTTP